MLCFTTAILYILISKIYLSHLLYTHKLLVYIEKHFFTHFTLFSCCYLIDNELFETSDLYVTATFTAVTPLKLEQLSIHKYFDDDIDIVYAAVLNKQV